MAFPSPMPTPRWTVVRTPDPARRYELVVLYLRVRRWWHRPLGIFFGIRIFNRIAREPGVVAYTYVHRPRTLEVWELALWDSVKDLARFVHSPVHQSAMRTMRPRLTGGFVTRIPLEGGAFPPSPEQMDRWVVGGRSLI